MVATVSSPWVEGEGRLTITGCGVSGSTAEASGGSFRLADILDPALPSASLAAWSNVPLQLLPA